MSTVAQFGKNDGREILRAVIRALIIAVVVLVVTFVIGCIAVIIRGERASPQEIDLINKILAIIAALLVAIFVGRPAAVAHGQFWGVTFKVTGAAATLVIFYSMFSTFAPQSEFKIIDVYLNETGAPVVADFDLLYRLVGLGQSESHGRDGYSVIRVPRGIDSVFIARLICTGYFFVPPHDVRIENNNTLQLPIRKDGPPEPSSGMPDVEQYLTAEHREMIKTSGQVPAERVNLWYANASGQPNLALILRDCTNHEKRDTSKYWPEWLTLNLPQTSEENIFERFHEYFDHPGGWFYVFLRINDKRRMTHRDSPVGLLNLFDSENPQLKVMTDNAATGGLRVELGRHRALSNEL